MSGYSESFLDWESIDALFPFVEDDESMCVPFDVTEEEANTDMFDLSGVNVCELKEGVLVEITTAKALLNFILYNVQDLNELDLSGVTLCIVKEGTMVEVTTARAFVDFATRYKKKLVSLPQAMATPTFWSPCSFLTPTPSPPFILVLLNQPIKDEKLVVSLWNSACYTVTVDGGSSVWHKLVNNTELAITKDNPDLITGDMDSAELSNVEHFRKCGTLVVETPDQNSTDFTKCLVEVVKQVKSDLRAAQGRVVVAFVETSGRMDQVMANMQTMFLARDLMSDLPLYLVSSDSVSCLLGPGEHRIEVEQVGDLDHCGLIPMAGEAVVTTSGLKWDLEGDRVGFGGLVSTSNAFTPDCREVKVITDNFLLWTMDLPH